MPLFDYKCPKCGTIRKDFFIDRSHMRKDTVELHVVCDCGAEMKRMIPLVHTKVGTSVDARDPGKVTREKNEKLKKREAGYQHDDRDLRRDIKRQTEERLKDQ